MNKITYRLAAGLAVLALGVSACGSSNDTGKQLQQQGSALQSESANLQQYAASELAAVKAGTKTQEQADAEIKAKTDALQKHALATENTAIDAAKSQNGVPDDAKQQLDDAQEQLNASMTQGQ